VHVADASGRASDCMAAVRRLPWLIAAAGVVIILAGAVLVLVRGTPSVDHIVGARSTPAPPTPPPDLLPTGARSTVPVLLVHGYAGAPSQMQPLADRLERDGRRVVLVSLPERGTLDLHFSAFAVLQAARQLHVPEVDVVGYSLGGIAARQALLFRDGSVRIRHLVMLATPNHGVRLPDDSGRPEQEHCEPNNACGELAPYSPLLVALNKSPYARGNRGWLTLASATDRLVHPPAAVALAGAAGLVLQQVCPATREDHGQMDDSPVVIGLTLLFLEDRMPADPVCDEALGAAAS
jgi:triacylglycerol lipase